MEAAGAAAAAAVRGGSLARVRAGAAYGCARGPGRLAAPGRRRVLVAVAALSEPLEPVPSPAQDVVVDERAPKADEEVHGDDTTAETETLFPSDAPGKTVRVRFVLRKECPFGQSFHLVGDDPALGLWDPVQAAALRWAEGHQWIVEKDLPASKLVEFKFLLRDASGRLHWQSGPNRSLQTGERVDTLVVYEDWDDVKNQKIEEEAETSVVVSDENGSRMGNAVEDVVVSDDKESRKDNAVEEELRMDDNNEEVEVEQDESVVVEEDGESAVFANDCIQGESMKANKANLPKPFPYEELKMLAQRYEEKEKKKNSCGDETYAEKTEKENILSEDGVLVEKRVTNAYEHDFLWGWKALKHLLMSLGFKMDTS